MNSSCFIWNVRGLNGRARRGVVRAFLLQHRASIVCLQETKLSVIPAGTACELLGPSFDYDFVPSIA